VRGTTDSIERAAALVGDLFGAAQVFDAASGIRVGSAQRRYWFAFGKSRGFLLRDGDGRVVTRVVPDPPRRWHVRDRHNDHVGSIVSALEPNWRGRLVPRGLSDPWDWTGWVVVDDQEVAYITSGNIIDTKSDRHLARLSTPGLPSKDGWWVLTVQDGVDGLLRVMALAWLGVGYDMFCRWQRSE
jgi:hypothetical protein